MDPLGGLESSEEFTREHIADFAQWIAPERRRKPVTRRVNDAAGLQAVARDRTADPLLFLYWAHPGQGVLHAGEAEFRGERNVRLGIEGTHAFPEQRRVGGPIAEMGCVAQLPCHGLRPPHDLAASPLGRRWARRRRTHDRAAVGRARRVEPPERPRQVGGRYGLALVAVI